jgi:hypothetical protein
MVSRIAVGVYVYSILMNFIQVPVLIAFSRALSCYVCAWECWEINASCPFYYHLVRWIYGDSAALRRRVPHDVSFSMRCCVRAPAGFMSTYRVALEFRRLHDYMSVRKLVGVGKVSIPLPLLDGVKSVLRWVEFGTWLNPTKWHVDFSVITWWCGKCWWPNTTCQVFFFFQSKVHLFIKMR